MNQKKIPVKKTHKGVWQVTFESVEHFTRQMQTNWLRGNSLFRGQSVDLPLKSKIARQLQGVPEAIRPMLIIDQMNFFRRAIIGSRGQQPSGVCPEFCVSDRFTLFRSFPRT